MNSENVANINRTTRPSGAPPFGRASTASNAARISARTRLPAGARRQPPVARNSADTPDQDAGRRRPRLQPAGLCADLRERTSPLRRTGACVVGTVVAAAGPRCSRWAVCPVDHARNGWRFNFAVVIIDSAAVVSYTRRKAVCWGAAPFVRRRNGWPSPGVGRNRRLWPGSRRDFLGA